MSAEQLQTEEQLRSMIAAKLKIPPEDVPMDVPIVAELGLDSIEVIKFLLEVEERFPPFSFADTSQSDLKTLRELARRLEAVS
jgi:acyl carrier protein